MLQRIIYIGFTAIFISSCSKNVDQIEETGLTGKVTNEQTKSLVSPAFIFYNDQLLAVTDATGEFQTNALEAGVHNLTCSAVGYYDQTINIEIRNNHNTTIEFSLSANDSKGKIYGEFHDSTLYEEQLNVNPTMGEWNAKELFDGVSGATMQRKTLLHEVPEIQVSIGDSVLATADGYGQYWFELQCGTYEIAGSCNGYKTSRQTVLIKPNEVSYVNFILTND